MDIVEIIKADHVAFVRGSKKSLIISFFMYSSFRAVCLYRFAHFFDKNLPILAWICEKLMHATTITWISRKAVIGPKFVIRHVGSIVIGGRSVFGSNCEIRQGVTTGGHLGKTVDGRTQPIIGNNVLIGAGAKVLGPVLIGNGCIIGANAVVVNNIPDKSVVGGVPGRIIREVRLGENPLIV